MNYFDQIYEKKVHIKFNKWKTQKICQKNRKSAKVI